MLCLDIRREKEKYLHSAEEGVTREEIRVLEERTEGERGGGEKCECARTMAMTMMRVRKERESGKG